MMNQIRIAALGLLLVGGTACVDDIVEPPPPPKASEAIHYWHFNNLPIGTLTSVPSNLSKVGTGVMTYPGTGAGYMDQVSPGTDLNAQSGEPAGLGLRLRNPAATRELLIVAPSTGYTKLVISYAAMRSSASGAEQHRLQYSADGTTWVNVAPAFDLTTIDPNWEKKSFNMESVTAVNNNANLRFRILFEGPAATNASGNTRVDNFLVEGVPN